MSNGRSTSTRSMALTPRVFLDTSALLSGLASPKGASNMILALAEAQVVALVVSEEVLVEAERNLQEKLPRAIPEYRRFLASCPLQKIALPSPADVEAAREIIHPKDAPILAAAMAAQMDCLVALAREHFIDDPEVARRSGLRVGTPGDFLSWLRNELEG
jgi:putative PIN family toxin of toxin-antitoxin system